MKQHTSVVLAILSLIALLSTVQAQEGGAVAVMESTSICDSPIEVLRAEILVAIESIAVEALGTPVEVIINCLAFGPERSLESAIVSAFPLNASPGSRYSISCQNNFLIPLLSTEPPRRFNLTSSPTHRACVDCVDGTNIADICPEQCPLECERCARFSGSILCTACDGYPLLNTYPPGAELTPEQIESEEESGAECAHNPVFDVELATSFSCVAVCPDFGNYSEPSPESGTCYACGIEYCVECERPEGEGATGGDECTVCLDDTVLFEGECYSCPLALVARTAILQEDEERREQAIQRMRQIELAVALPIVSLLVIVVFISLSIYAHHRYPHVSYQGHKRHRTKQDVFTGDIASSSSAVGAPPSGDEDAVPQSGVWRAQPSIRFR